MAKSHKFWNVDGGSPEASPLAGSKDHGGQSLGTATGERSAAANLALGNVPDSPAEQALTRSPTVADAEPGDSSATAETSPAICRPDPSEADAKRLAEICRRYNWCDETQDASVLLRLLDAALAKSTALIAERDDWKREANHFRTEIERLIAERDSGQADYQIVELDEP